ncbi:hypothetical protein Pyn_34358 [Prunus yedoensis var. nudiflora]|uniref:Uncharacterized protein n=1 Tax=Prunus yedoensis var. nudiflora TaxID=2094558 RepID=A0A314YQV7_PRUYE|nr:hypothetical protein Pyn_34358 [Prunus yedoensis var. nudiflora]
MLGSIAAAGAWIRKSKEYFVELQSLREKKVHQDLMETEVRLERLTEELVAREIELKAMKSDMEEGVRTYEQQEGMLKEMEERVKEMMNEQEKEKENPMEK